MQMLERINAIVWGIPTIILIIGVGIYLSLFTGFSQVRLFPMALKSFFGGLFCKVRSDGVSSFQALCTALAATVGTGNIAGVAGAIAIGGPGAVFWMWICSFLGMIIKFAEATLSVRYHTIDADGRYMGGTMYMIQNGLGARWSVLAKVYCFFGVIAAFGVGNATQIDALMGGFHSALSFAGLRCSQSIDLAVGLVLAVTVCMMLLGGAQRIGLIAETFVPLTACAYLLLGLGVLIRNMNMIPFAFRSIFVGAFSPSAVTGGTIMSCIFPLRTGISRGVFTNEAGMGTASIAYGSAQSDTPVQQGLMGIIEVFLDTTVICTLTALVILCSGTGIYYGIDEGAALTTRAFSVVYGDWISVPMALFLCCFAFATVLGWGLYGARCAEYLFGDGAWKWFCYLQGLTVFLSVFLKTGTVWLLAETVNGLMAIPNLFAVLLLSPEVIRLVKNYRKNIGKLSAEGGTYESFNQFKSLPTLSYEKVSSPCCGSAETWKEDLSSEYWSA